MNKWSTSLPSIISLCNNVQFSFDPMFMQQVATSSNRNQNNGAGSSLTDLSILIHTQPPFINYEQYPDNYNQSSKQQQQQPSFYEAAIEHQTTIETDITTHEQFVPDDELLQSLVAYADSFDLDSTVYSIQNSKTQPMTATTSISTMQSVPRRRTQSSTTLLTSIMENNTPMSRHKSCDDLSITCSITSSSKPTTVIQRDEHVEKSNFTKFVASESHPQFYFSTPTNKDNRNNNINNNNNNHHHHYDKSYDDKQIEEATSTTGGSKIEWGFSSDTMNELNKPSSDVFSSYEATTNIGDINLHYLKDLEHVSTMAASMDFSQEPTATIPPRPVIIRKKSKDLLLKQQVDIQLLRPPTPPAPAPIIIREVRHRPHPSNKSITIHQKLEDTGQIHLSKTPSPIVLRERPPPPPKHDYPSKPTIVYRHIQTPSSSPPTVIVERLRSNMAAVIQKPAPILVEKWLPYPPEQKRKIIYECLSPPPVREKRHASERSKKIIVEYDDVNVIFDRDIKQRKDVKRVSPDRYVRRYGNSLYSNETLNHILSNKTCASQAKQQYSFFPHQHHYENYSPIFH
ncbi:unnamed protein product [Adineta steineri]|uniref:Uncharacterized protein n=1 Tax=Adineta steineri TaxID=433720 RepID=A0A813TKK8_9BILA|nr:unnamed protein product [Adineta steineri]